MALSACRFLQLGARVIEMASRVRLGFAPMTTRDAQRPGRSGLLCPHAYRAGRAVTVTPTVNSEPALATSKTIRPLVERVEAAAHGSAGATRLTWSTGSTWTSENSRRSSTPPVRKLDLRRAREKL